MRTRPAIPLIAHMLVFGGLTLAFVVGSIRPLMHSLGKNTFGPVSPYQTTDNYLSWLTGRPDSERLLETFARLASRKPIAVISLEDQDESTLLAFLVMYFAWPHEVEHAMVERSNASARLEALEKDAPSAIFFCNLIPPPMLHPQVAIGRNLTMVPRGEVIPEQARP